MPTPHDNEWLMLVVVQLESRAPALALGQVPDLSPALARALQTVREPMLVSTLAAEGGIEAYMYDALLVTRVRASAPHDG